MGVLVDNLRRRAETAGDKPAFRFGTDDLSYGHLVERANQLATSLHQRGVRAGDRVGILQGKGMGNPLAVYGVLAAGAAYVPIDPAAPLARQAAIVADCGIRHVITDDERATRAGKLAATASQPLTLYGAAGPVGERTVSWDEIATASTATPSVTADIDGPAYIIFTSGSTGVPKGIVHSHRTGGAYAAMAAELYGLTDHDRLSNFPPLHFDQSTFDLFSGPSVGATTVIIGKDHQLVPASLSALIEAERLTVWYSVPLALIQLLLYGVLEERDHTSLRWVVYGGEPFPVKHLRALMAQWPNARFSNCYGPAETNQCTYHHLDPQDLAPGDDGAIPIGVPCPGMTTLVVDAEDRPVEPGDDGQLLVSSPTTMVGYWGRPDLDRASFLHRHPGGDASDADRYYRTGDLVRQGPDGLLDFLGRVDRQIKVRGARVELDEVELVLSSHEAVEEVAVAALPGEDGPTVAAWVSARPGHRPDEAGLRRHAGRQLTRVAIPSTIAIVDRFPRTTSGKIDYLTLTAGPGSRPTGDDSASTGKQDDDHR